MFLLLLLLPLVQAYMQRGAGIVLINETTLMPYVFVSLDHQLGFASADLRLEDFMHVWHWSAEHNAVRALKSAVGITVHPNQLSRPHFDWKTGTFWFTARVPYRKILDEFWTAGFWDAHELHVIYETQNGYVGSGRKGQSYTRSEMFLRNIPMETVAKMLDMQITQTHRSG